MDKLNDIAWLRRLAAVACAAICLLAPGTGTAGGGVHFSGSVVSATGILPPALAAFADCEDGRPRIVGRVESGRYAIDLPAGFGCRLVVGDWDWDAAPLAVDDAGSAVAPAILVYPNKLPEPALARELIDMGQRDQALRDKWDPAHPDFAAHAQDEDGARQRRLADIIAAKGWPGISMVGWDAAGAAWRIAQHAPPERLAAWLPLMREAGTRHEILPAHLAMSTDRVLALHEKRRQRYGTAYRVRPDGLREPFPVEDPAQLDQRRLGVGLPPYTAPPAGCERYAETLNTMAGVDQALRRKMNDQDADGAAWQRLGAAIAIVDRENTRRLQTYVARCGWPARALYGRSAAHDAWLLAQHSPDLAFKKQALALIEKAARARGQPFDTDSAYLADRIAAAEKRPQRFGTQMRMPTPDHPCRFEFLPMDDRERVEARRRALHMEPLEAYRMTMLKSAQCPVETSAAPAATPAN